MIDEYGDCDNCNFSGLLATMGGDSDGVARPALCWDCHDAPGDRPW